MRRHAADTVVTAALRHLDPAPRTDLTEAERERADAAFARIVATPSDEPVPLGAGPTAPASESTAGDSGSGRRRRCRHPGLLLGGGTAYGSWTPRPEPLTDVAAAEAATTCRAALDVPDRGERVAMAERRGEWTYVLLAGPGTEAICLMPDDLVGQDPTAREDFFGSYDTDTVAPPTLDPDRIDETTSMQGSTEEGWFSSVRGLRGQRRHRRHRAHLLGSRHRGLGRRQPVRCVVAVQQAELRPAGRDVVVHRAPRRREHPTHQLTSAQHLLAARSVRRPRRRQRGPHRESPTPAPGRRRAAPGRWEAFDLWAEPTVASPLPRRAPQGVGDEPAGLEVLDELPEERHGRGTARPAWCPRPAGSA